MRKACELWFVVCCCLECSCTIVLIIFPFVQSSSLFHFIVGTNTYYVIAGQHGACAALRIWDKLNKERKPVPAWLQEGVVADVIRNDVPVNTRDLLAGMNLFPLPW